MLKSVLTIICTFLTDILHAKATAIREDLEIQRLMIIYCMKMPTKQLKTSMDFDKKLKTI